MYKVYLYTCKTNNKKYCGITNRTLEKRSEGNGYGYIRSVYKARTKFARAILKYGWEDFSPEILYEVETLEEASELEIKTIADMNLTNDEFGYNMHFGGTKVNPAMCGKKGKENAMYGKGYKLEGAKNGRAVKTKITFPNGECLMFDTQKDARDYLNISKDMFRSVRDYEGKFKFSIMTNKSKIEKNKHLIGIEINILE